MNKPDPEPFHPPIGLSDEGFSSGRRWLVAAAAVLLILAAGIVAAVTL